jgi:3-oxoacyl-[acyl-carrier protein] reductase
MDLQLDGKKALVTGSSRGIGEAIVKAFARESAIVIVHGRDKQKAAKVAEEISDRGGHAHVVLGDLTHEDDVERLVKEAERQIGRIDILVNNAGGSGGSGQSWADIEPKCWTDAYDRNVLAALRITKLLLPRMQKVKWGRVINISSVAAIMPPSSSPDYSACKAAMNAMTVSMAKSVAADGVTVNAVSPGTIHSATLDRRFRDVASQRGLANAAASWDEIERAVLPIFAQVPIGRVGRLEEVANATAFLASPLAAYITGINLRVDGGLLPSL